MSEGIGSGTPGRLTPLCAWTTPPTTTSQRARPRSTFTTRSLTSPSSMSTSFPGCSTDPSTAGLTGRSSALRGVLAGDHDRVAVGELDVRVEIADPELRPLQVGDQGDRPAGGGLGLAHELRAPRMVLPRPVREVEARSVHPGRDQRGERLRVRRGGPDGRDDLRAARVPGHRGQISPLGFAGGGVRRLRAGTRPSRGTTASPPELLLDPQELVVLRDAVGARRGARS